MVYRGRVGLAAYRAAGQPLTLDEIPSLCDVRDCTNMADEKHHWAPRKLFGADAGKWPAALLCKDHHAYWHRTVWPQS
jgi:hypothetical protein